MFPYQVFALVILLIIFAMFFWYQHQRRQVEQKLKASEKRFRAIFEQSPIAIQLYDKAGKLIDVNPQTLALFGVEDKRYILGYDMWTSQKMSDEEAAALRRGEPIFIQATLDFADVKSSNLFPTNKTGVIHVDLYAAPMIIQQETTGYIVQLIDVTERKQIEHQLQQSQKMESIGRLAGGVAHDFNNLLSVIIGFTEISMEELQPSSPLYQNMEEILSAAKRSRDITRQLLAFARKEVITPEALEINSCIDNMIKILQRLIGEDIHLNWQPSDQALPILMDRSQLEQILANLCINARDAITDVGEITIETDLKSDHELPKEDSHVESGEYVMLAVRDNGHGMDQETIDNIFEPFFTTKGVGQGTGLGLSTVHGIVKQNKGIIHVDSEPGKGTSFQIYLPRHLGPIPKRDTPQPKAVSPGDRETLLVVEDDSSILKLIERILTRQRYHVLTSSSPLEALALLQRHNGQIDLLITDVVMPGMNGKELAEQLKATYPALTCLYMSGYTADVIAHRGLLNEDINFLQKPFTHDQLVQSVKAILAQSDPDESASSFSR